MHFNSAIRVKFDKIMKVDKSYKKLQEVSVREFIYFGYVTVIEFLLLHVN